MRRVVRHALTGEEIFGCEVEVAFYRWLDDYADGYGTKYKHVMVSYEVAPAFRQAYLSRAERHETWVLPL